MKKICLIMTVAASCLSAQQMNAQQRKSTTKKPTTTQVVPVSVDEPLGVDGHLAFMGVSQGQTLSKVKSDLAAKGFREGKDHGVMPPPKEQHTELQVLSMCRIWPNWEARVSV